MMLEGGQALRLEPPHASSGGTDNKASHVATADATLSRSGTGITTMIAESKDKPEDIPKSDAEPESKDELESQYCSQEVRDLLYHEFRMYSDSDPDIPSESDEEFGDSDSELENPMSSDVVWFLREKRAWETQDNGLFVRMMITDVMKHCLQNISLHAALNIWRWKTNRTREYWCCFNCDKRFPDQKSHMLHMESEHHLGLSWDHDCLLPSQVWQECQSGVNKGVKERTNNLDDSIKVDSTYRAFLVDMGKFGSSFQNKEVGKVQYGNLFGDIIRGIQDQLRCLVNMFDTKSKLCWSSEIGELDAEIVENFARLNMLKHNLSNLCVSDYKNEVLPSISSFLKKKNLLDSGLRSWALQRLNDLLRSIRSPWHLDSFSLELKCPGKVIINIEEYNARIRFAYVGICWKFAGDLSIKRSRKIKGIFVFSAVTTSDGGKQYYQNAILDKKSQRTAKMCSFRQKVEYHLSRDLTRKVLPQFEAEFMGRLQR